MDTTVIKQEINDNVKTNGVGAITGQVLNQTLNDMVDAVTPKFYDEDEDTNDVNINTNANIELSANDKVELKTSGYMFRLSDEEAIRLGSNGDDTFIKMDMSDGINIKDGNATLHFGSDGLRISLEDQLNQLIGISFSWQDGLVVKLNDGDPFIMSFDTNNNLQVAGVSILAQLESLQEQIDELKNA